MTRAAAALVVLAVGAAGCREAGAPARGVVAGDPDRGRELIAAYGCGGCHAVPGVAGASGAVGPSLEGFADRTFIAGRLRNEPASLVHWIQSPQEVDPGTAMPDLGVGEPQARHIAAYLYTLHAGGLGPPHLIPESVLPQH